MTRIALDGRLNDTPADFRRLFRVIQEALDSLDDIEFDLESCTFLRTNAVVLLGGAALAVKAAGRQASFLWPRDMSVYRFLGKCDFRPAFGGTHHHWTDNSVPFRHDASRVVESLVHYLREDWLGRGWIDVSEGLRDAIVGKMIEVYENAFEHSDSSVGCVSCGQHYPQQKTLTLTVADFGIGIAGSVKQFLRQSSLSDEGAIKWAFESGNTTKPQRGTRGIGLKLLRDFVSTNGGCLEVYTNSAYAKFTRDQPQFASITGSFDGTVIHISLRCDESHYRLSSESSIAELF